MSLRLRLTLLYTNLLGGVVLILGIVVYSIVNVALVDQIDITLQHTATDIISNLRGDLNIDLNSLSIPDNVSVQIWGADHQFIASTPNVQRFTTPIDARGLEFSTPVYRDVQLDQSPACVLTIPLVVPANPQRFIGWLQVGTNLALVETTQRALLTVLVVTAVIAMALAALIGWLVFGRALSPLETVTEAATQISRAEDLSRRIPYSGPKGDEVGQLILAFNQTLNRLEQLFTAQRRFMADVSHELRTPLTVIKGNVGLMRHMSEVDDESLTSIEGEVDRLTRMVGDLLLLAQAESGKIPLDLRPIEVDTILLEVFQQMRVLAGDRQQVKLVDIDQLTVNGDRDRLNRSSSTWLETRSNILNREVKSIWVFTGMGDRRASW